MTVIECSSRCVVEFQILPSLTATAGARIGFAIAGVWALAWGLRLIARQVNG